MSNKDKFKFINEESSNDDFLIKEEVVEAKEKDALVKKVPNKKKSIIKKIIILNIFLTLFAAFLVWFSLKWQNKSDSMAITNALWFAFVVEFTVAWAMFVYNHNVFSPLIHGTKTFLGMLIGKKPNVSYYDYMKNIQDNPLPPFYYRLIFVHSLLLLIPSVILLIKHL